MTNCASSYSLADQHEKCSKNLASPYQVIRTVCLKLAFKFVTSNFIMNRCIWVLTFLLSRKFYLVKFLTLRHQSKSGCSGRSCWKINVQYVR